MTLPPATDGTSPGLLRFRGADAAKFLQGQLSNDMTALDADRLLLAGLHNAQGRVLALLRLVAPAPDDVIALLPAELAEPIAAQLRRFVLRARLTIVNESAVDAMGAAAAAVPALAAALRDDSRAAGVAAGLPQVYAATSGEFVSQMLNLDCIDAISFNKGCYTGQEIIARAHYRGRMKRRMQRFVSAAEQALTPGQPIRLGDGRTARVVDAALRADGRTEFLAVTALSAPGSDEMPETTAGASETRVDCSALPLPYALPE